MSTSSQFVKSVIGKVSRKSAVREPYLKKNEEWRFSLARLMLTGIFKNQFYRSADAAAKEALPLCIKGAQQDPDYVLKACAFAREAHMKGNVKVGLAALAGNARDAFLERNRNEIIAILSTFHPGQLLQFVELMKSKQLGRGFGSRPQKWVQEAMQSWKADKIEDYTLKYPTPFKTLLRLVHPNYTTTRGNLVRYVLDASHKFPKYGHQNPYGKKQKAVEKMKGLRATEHSIAKSMLENDIPWDVVKGFHPITGDVGLAMLTKMGLTALLLNVRSLEQNGVLSSPSGLKAFELKLDEVKYGRAIPLDFAKPYLYSSNVKVKKLLVKAIVDSLDNKSPDIEDRKIGLSVDISGSMQGEPLKTAGLLAVPFLKAKDLWFTTFDTELWEEGKKVTHTNRWHPQMGPIGSFICPKLNGCKPETQVERLLNLRIHGGTNISVAIKDAISNHRFLDVMVLVTDEQQNAGTPLVKAWSEYKRRVNPNAELWVINATNYEWHSADFGDPSITVYQSMTPAIFKNIQFAGQDVVAAIQNYDLKKVTRKKKKSYKTTADFKDHSIVTTTKRKNSRWH